MSASGSAASATARYELAIFPKGSDTPAAVGHFVHVYVDAGTRRSVALTEAQKASMSDLTAEPFAG